MFWRLLPTNKNATSCAEKLANLLQLGMGYEKMFQYCCFRLTKTLLNAFKGLQLVNHCSLCFLFGIYFYISIIKFRFELTLSGAFEIFSFINQPFDPDALESWTHCHQDCIGHSTIYINTLILMRLFVNIEQPNLRSSMNDVKWVWASAGTSNKT